MQFKGAKTSTMLVEQYRMNEGIMRWSSEAMYESKLVAHADVKERSVVDLMPKGKSPEASELSSSPLLIIDTAGALVHESVEGNQVDSGLAESKSNEGEADLVIQTVQELIGDLGLKSSDIGVISPYNAQVNLIRKLLKPLGLGTIEISTVDGF